MLDHTLRARRPLLSAKLTKICRGLVARLGQAPGVSQLTRLKREFTRVMHRLNLDFPCGFRPRAKNIEAGISTLARQNHKHPEPIIQA